MQQDGVEAGVKRRGVDAGGVAIDPVGDGAIGVVVVGVHAGSSIIGRRSSAPRWWSRRGRPGSPRRDIGVEQQVVGEVGVAGLGELFEQVGRAEEAGAEQAVVGFDLVDQHLRSGGAEVLGQQVHVQREHVAGLGVAALAFGAGIVDLAEGGLVLSAPATKPSAWTNCFSKGGADFVEEAGVFFVVLGAAGGLGHLLHERDVVGPVGGGDEGVVGLAFGRKPVAEVGAGLVLPEAVGVGGIDGVEIAAASPPSSGR